MKILLILLFVLLAADSEAATRYADGSLTANCLTTYNPSAPEGSRCGSGSAVAYGTTNGNMNESNALQVAINASTNPTDVVQVRTFSGVYSRGQTCAYANRSGGGGIAWNTQAPLTCPILLRSGSGWGDASTRSCTACFKIEGYGPDVNPFRNAAGRPTTGPYIRQIGAGADGAEWTVQYVWIKDVILDASRGYPTAPVPPWESANGQGITSSRWENVVVRNHGNDGFAHPGPPAYIINADVNNNGLYGWTGNFGEQCRGAGMPTPPVGTSPGGFCHGIYYDGPTWIEGGEWHHGTGFGIHCRAGIGCAGATVRNVKVYNNNATGIFSEAGMTITNSVIYNNGDRGIWAAGSTIQNSTLYGNGAIYGGADIEANTNVTIRNTIAITNGISVPGGTFANNICPQTPSFGCTTNATASTLFVNPTGTPPDFHLASGTGPATNTGTSTNCPTTDIDGALYGAQCERGAYAFGAAPPVTVSVTIGTNSGNPISCNPTTCPGATQTLSGTTTGTVTSVAWSNSRGGSGSCTGTTSWNCQSAILGIPLFVGDNTITVTATAGAVTATDTIPVLYTPTLPAPSLVLSMGFDTSTTTTTPDFSGNSNTGTLTPPSPGGPTWTSSGKYGSAISFDGTNDYVNIADSNSLDLVQSMTLMAWIFPTGFVTGEPQAVIVKNPSPGDESTPYALYASGFSTCGANIGFGRITINNDSVDRPVCSNSPPFPLNTWTHIATTYDGAELKFYRDGALTTTVARTGLLVPTSGTLTIGKSPSGEFFRGTIDEPRIYNYALTAGEIVTARDTPITAPVPPTGLKLSSGTIRKYTSGAIEKTANQ